MIEFVKNSTLNILLFFVMCYNNELMNKNNN